MTARRTARCSGCPSVQSRPRSTVAIRVGGGEQADEIGIGVYHPVAGEHGQDENGRCPDYVRSEPADGRRGFRRGRGLVARSVDACFSVKRGVSTDVGGFEVFAGCVCWESGGGRGPGRAPAGDSHRPVVWRRPGRWPARGRGRWARAAAAFQRSARWRREHSRAWSRARVLELGLASPRRRPRGWRDSHSPWRFAARAYSRGGGPAAGFRVALRSSASVCAGDAACREGGRSGEIVL